MKFSDYILNNPQSTRKNAKILTDWVLGKDVADAELNDYVAFVYRITLKDGSSYIGRKKLWQKAGPRAPSTYPRKVFQMSDWLFYNTSSTYVSGKVKNNDFSRAEIIHWSTSWSLSALDETLLILQEWESGVKNWNRQVEIPMLSKSQYLGKPCI